MVCISFQKCRTVMDSKKERQLRKADALFSFQCSDDFHADPEADLRSTKYWVCFKSIYVSVRFQSLGKTWMYKSHEWCRTFYRIFSSGMAKPSSMNRSAISDINSNMTLIYNDISWNRIVCNLS